MYKNQVTEWFFPSSVWKATIEGTPCPGHYAWPLSDHIPKTLTVDFYCNTFIKLFFCLILPLKTTAGLLFHGYVWKTMRTNINHTCCINRNPSINWEYTRLFSKIRGVLPFFKISICSCVTPLPPWHAVGWEPHLGSAVPEGILSQQPGALIWGHSEDHVLILISYSSVCGSYG